MSLYVVAARRWQEYELESKTLVAQFGNYDLIRDGLHEVTDAEDYELANLVAYASKMHQALVTISKGKDHGAVVARALLKDIHHG